jgi:molybdopterin-binding protein
LVGQIGLLVGDQRLTAVISAEAVNDLRLRRGDNAVAIIKSTDVVIAKESFPTGMSRRRRRRKD